LEGFVCPKPKTGVLCCDCNLREGCPFLHPVRPPPKRYSSKQFQPFQPLPTEIAKYNYRVLLLVAETFQLTKAEIQDLVFYTTRFAPFARKGGRGKSWRRIYALTCIELLRRDKRLIYDSNRSFYNRRFQLHKRDTKELRKFVRKEIRRINKTIPTLRCLQNSPETNV
jgi:hypothetical protein